LGLGLQTGNWETGSTAQERGHIESIAAASYQATKLLGGAYSSAGYLREASSDNGDSKLAIHLGVKDHAKDYVGLWVY
jgi:hypothetical protein